MIHDPQVIQAASTPVAEVAPEAKIDVNLQGTLWTARAALPTLIVYVVAGRYLVNGWDTEAGDVVERREVAVAGEPLRFATAPIERDRAYAIRRL